MVRTVPSRVSVALQIVPLLLFLSCRQSEAEESLSPVSEMQEVESRESEHRDKALVEAGTFLFGATEEQITYFLNHSRVNFPGMVAKIRAIFLSPPRNRHLDGFYMDQFEVTNQQFKQFLEETQYAPSSKNSFLKHWSGNSYQDWATTFPVVWISYEDAKAYCEWRGGQLPSGEQWEKAAKGTDALYFPWGDEDPTRETANFSTDQAEPVGNRPFDVSPYQAYDMGGNVAELTTGTNGNPAVRGGSFRTGIREMLATYRVPDVKKDYRQEYVGFRCVTSQ
jgi:serine/threonine-protein kinase